MLTRTVDQSREKGQETIVSACELFGVNRQVYYRKKRSFSKRRYIAQQVVDLVQEQRMRMPRVGTRKLYYLLEDKLKALGVGRDKLFAILKANHMLMKPKRSYRKTTDSHHRFRKHKNLIQELTLLKPEQVWVSDITYIGSRPNHRYLALVTDAYSKKIMGFDLSSSLSAGGAIRAMKKSLKQRSYKNKDLIHHSDRGLQYCCDDYQEVLLKNKIKCSMTESYDPYANAIAERVNGILKQEFMLEEYELGLPVMKEIVKESIDIYNNERPHLSCHMNTPSQMHKQRKLKVKSYKKSDHIKASFDMV